MNDIAYQFPRPSSIKTRIMTPVWYPESDACCDQRQLSITTRIKTCNPASFPPCPLRVLDHPPLQQGFRRKTDHSIVNCVHVRDHLPLKQGLRLCKRIVYCDCSLIVRYHIPLQQGLRLCSWWVIVIIVHNVRDYLPLKQGLRKLFPCLIVHKWDNPSEAIFHFHYDKD